MCDLNKIGALIAAAGIALLVAIGLFTAAAFAAGTFYGAFGNGVLMTLAAISVGVALASINLAIGSIGQCSVGSCKSMADTIQNALIACAIALTVLLAAVILGVFGTSIPWAGTAVAIALGVAGLAIAISFIVISNQLPALDLCLRAAPTPAVTVAKVVLWIAVVVLVLIAIGATVPLG